MATFTNFCCKASGSNLNAGTLLGDTTEPGTAPSYAYDGTFSTNTFTVTGGRQGGSSTNPQSDGVTAGMFVHVNDGSATGRVARITSVTSSTIVLSGSATAGSGTGAIVANVGGAMLGPNGTTGFPLTLGLNAVVNANGDPVRLNLKNDQTYSMTAGITTATSATKLVRGYSSSYGDGGRATLDGGTSGASYVLLTVGASSAQTMFRDMIFSNNGASSNSHGVVVGGSGSQFRNCIFTGFRGSGVNCTATSHFSECEAYGNNLSNTANGGGFLANTTCHYLRCIAHDNTGSNSCGFVVNDGSFHGCIADSNANDGLRITSASAGSIISGCDSYNNGGDGIQTAGANTVIENCNLLKNTAAGINASAATGVVVVRNCGYGSGSMANSANSGNIDETGAITYASGVTPWVDPDNGDFRINSAQAKNAGRGTFTQTASSYAGTVAYPDVGAGQSQGVIVVTGGKNTVTARAASCFTRSAGSRVVRAIIVSGGASPTLPAEDDVRDGVSYGAGGTEFTGNLTSPAAGDVEEGVQYGASGTEFTGTFAVPAEADVRDSVGYGAGGSEFTGSYAPVAGNPAESDVRDGVVYGPTSNLTGTLELPAPGDVESGVGYGDGGSEFTGTFLAPAASNVRNGVGYGAAGTQFTGDVVLPATSDVRDGVGYDSLSAQTGTLELPDESTVQEGVQYGAAGTEFTGTYSPDTVQVVLPLPATRIFARRDYVRKVPIVVPSITVITQLVVNHPRVVR